jgi:hypothetical protein
MEHLKKILQYLRNIGVAAGTLLAIFKLLGW